MSSGSVSPGHRAVGSTVRVLSDRYRLDEAIGHGGIGVVWRARDLQLERDVAVKELQPGLARDPRASERFRREAMQAASLTHPSMVTIFDVGEDDAVPYLVMELVDGPSLAELLARRGRLGPVETAVIGHEVAAGLASVHARGLVHRDVKPGNVLMSADGSPRLIDFGAVHIRDEFATELTTPGTMLGTIGYIAPEQLDGHPVDPRADVYSLGLVLYQCLTGTPAFGTGTIAELTQRRLTEDAPAPSARRPDVPTDLDAIIVAATHRDPDRRLENAGRLADLLAPMVPDDARERLAALLEEDAARTTALPTPASVPAAANAGATSVMASPPPVSPPPPAPTDVVDRRDRTLPWGLVLPLVGLLALALAIAIVGLGSLGGQEGGGDGDEGGGAPATGEPLAIAEGADLDPFGGGGEHPDSVPNAYDDDPATRWDTEGYNSPTLDKDGVGMWVRLDSDQSASRVEIDLDIPGATVEVYGLEEEPGDDPDDWPEPVGTESDAEGTLAYDLPEGTNAVLVWFTEVGPDSEDGRHRGAISEIRLFQ